MSSVIAGIAATFITVPILGFIISYLIAVRVTGNERRAFLLASDLTTLLFILSVYFLILVIWEVNLLGMILIFMIISIAIFLYLQWKSSEELKMRKVLKGFWRFSFLVFGFAYFSLTLYGLISRLFV